jgi:hypothetical protein
MHPYLHIAQGDARRAAGKGVSRVASRMAAWACYPEQGAQRSMHIKVRRETHHHLPELDKRPITESPIMRSLLSKNTTAPVVFKVICRSRRLQLWNRQASIIMNLTALARGHGRRCLPRV